MEYKYSTINEVNHFEFGEAVVGDIQLTERMFHLVLDNVKICPENSCNRDIRMQRIPVLFTAERGHFKRNRNSPVSKE